MDIYSNNDDIVLGPDAPPDRYIATTLGQNTLIFSDESDTIETSYDAELHSGTWTFSTNACVYVSQAQDLISTLECSRGVNKIEINFIPEVQSINDKFDPAEWRKILKSSKIKIL